MKGMAVLVAATTALSASPVRAAEHVTSSGAVRAALAGAADERARDLASVDRVLASSEAARLASRVGVDVAGLRGALPALGDSELRDLAVRAETLQSDPAAGLTHDVEQLLIIFLLVALVILVLKAVD